MFSSVSGSGRTGVLTLRARPGIRAKMLAAFGAVAGLTLVASGVELVSYKVVGSSFAAI